LVPAWHWSCHFGSVDRKLALTSSPLFASNLSQFHITVCDHWGGYNFCVARGWESKSVEEQQAEAATPRSAKPLLTAAQIAIQRQRQGLMLSRQHVLQLLEAAQNPRHREILQRSLTDLDAQLARLV